MTEKVNHNSEHLRDALNTLEKENRIQRTRITELQDNLAELDGRLAERDRELADLEAKLKEAKKTIKTNSNEMRARWKVKKCEGKKGHILQNLKNEKVYEV